MKKTHYAILQKPKGYRTWDFCPTENPAIYRTKQMAEHQSKKSHWKTKYHKIVAVEINLKQGTLL